MSEDTSEEQGNPPGLRNTGEVTGIQAGDPSSSSSNLVLDLESETEYTTGTEDDEPSTSDEDTATSDEDIEDLDLILQRDDITLSESITDEIRKGVYTCLICTGEVDQDCKVWSCHLCYRVYDLDCIKSWATKGSSTDIDRSWRCPACNGKHHKIPKTYTCWCGKIVNPITNIINPHSCSNTCNHKLASCSHGCSLSCHPGPHVKRCGAIGPVMSCYCGDRDQQLPCIMTPYGTGWSCGKVCQDMMPCGLHRCQKTCHSGLCGACKETVVGKCYCGKHEREMFCYERRPKKSVGTTSEWIGVYACEDVCAHPLDCGNHLCESGCHPQSPKSHECPLDPKLASSCHCGKVAIETLIPGGRQSCTEPVPTCGNKCGKTLRCGHECIWLCHDGECSPCYKTFTAKCSCNYSQFLVSCAFLEDGCLPKCTHKCQALLNCRRHRCNKECCADEPVAMNRERERKKQIRKAQLNGNEDDSANIEAVHICTRDCGKLLACGLHHCNRGCHVGACPPCLESSSEDLVCSCGNTVVPAPVRCGTKLPTCPHPCPRVPVCGHPKIPHNCHEDDKECPKCTKLVIKQCQCHRKLLVKNVMCFQEIVSCGNVCGKKLECGHRCTKTCHRDGNCLAKCLSKCGHVKQCGHADQAPCHYPRDCNEKIPCPTLITLACSCGRISKEVTCGATAGTPSLEGKVLECDEECERVERNRRLFEALSLNGAGEGDQSAATAAAATAHTPSLLSEDMIDKLLELENPYPKPVMNVYRKQKSWCETVERSFRALAASKDVLKSTHHFPPMTQPQRQFIHELAEVYKFYSQSQDPEPRRSVMIQKLQSSRPPRMTLDEGFRCLTKLEQREQHRRDKLAAGVREVGKVRGASGGDIYFNAIAIQNVFFGITRDDIERAIGDLVSSSVASGKLKPPVTINYISDSMYVVYAGLHTETSPGMEQALAELVTPVVEALKSRSVAFSAKLCKVDESGFVVYEIEGGNNNNGVETKVGTKGNEQQPAPVQPAPAPLPAALVKDQQWW